MAVNVQPSVWFANWTSDGTDITVPIASFPEMTADEADPTTGDIRRVWYAMTAQLYAHWLSLATLDRPTKMVITKSQALSGSTLVESFTVTFYSEILSQEVLDEPTPTPTSG